MAEERVQGRTQEEVDGLAHLFVVAWALTGVNVFIGRAELDEWGVYFLLLLLLCFCLLCA
jgi:hypothetical protein